MVEVQWREACSIIIEELFQEFPGVKVPFVVSKDIIKQLTHRLLTARSCRIGWILFILLAVVHSHIRKMLLTSSGCSKSVSVLVV